MMDELAEDIDLAKEASDRGFFVRENGDCLQFINKIYYDQAAKDTDTVKVILGSGNKATILYSIEDKADMKYVFFCNHESWDGKKRDTCKLDTSACKVCPSKCCEICQFDRCCQRHRPFVSISPDGHRKKITMYGFPEKDVWYRAAYFRDVFRMDVEVRPLC